MLPEFSSYFLQAKEQIDAVRGKPQTREQRCDRAVVLAASMAREAERVATTEEKRRQERLAQLVGDPAGKAFLVALADQCFRSRDNRRVADQLRFLLNGYGLPRFLKGWERWGFRLFRFLGWPALVPFVEKRIRQEAAAVIIEEERLQEHLKRRKQEGIRLNLNHLGEAILGEEEAEQRLQVYLKDLTNPAIDYISVKISTLYSQVNLLSQEKTLEILGERLRRLYASGKFINLDMEEYRDLRITVDLFQRVLSDPEFQHLEAGIVLQSYLPDAFLLQQELTRFAQGRVSPIKIRLVKGANLAMEQVEASLRGWPQAPYTSKQEVDANFKRMLEYGCQRDRARAVHLGIGSHNLFDIAYALLLRSENECEPYVGFEMLEGMADPLGRVVKALSGGLLLYCPVADAEHFQNAVAYLVRRLDENTAPDNYLSDSFDCQPGSAAWERQEKQFREACVEEVSSQPRRQQNRQLEQEEVVVNEPDTDWSLSQNVQWAHAILDAGKKGEIFSHVTESDTVVTTALQAGRAWGVTSARERSALLAKVAKLLRRHRGDLIGSMVSETAKTVAEADIEISEAVDFVEFYRRNAEELEGWRDIRWHPKGVVLVASPWNFPCSIPVGGVAAALAAGNTVLFKPAPEAVSVGWQLAKLFWEGGISRDVLQFIACEDEPVGSALVSDPRVASVILTGATETARLFLRLRPDLDLMAETGGKNAMIITRLADRDLSIRDLIQSAFGYSGQKCSACSLAILEAEVYDDPSFRRALCDAAASLCVGTPWDLATRVNPLIRPPGAALHRALTSLEEGEEWLLEPRQVDTLLYTPGIKLGVRSGSFTHQTELFGPLLGIMKADHLEHAIALANGTPYGLTSGIHTLDEREKQVWLEKIEAGNCYINRTITGAIVLRQPFGGCKASSFGPGAKAGGPNYVMQLMRPESLALPLEREPVSPEVAALGEPWRDNPLWEASVGSYAFFWKQHFSRDHDPFQLLGQENRFRYMPHKRITLWVQPGDSPLDVARVRAAALICGTPLDIQENLSQLEGITRLRCLSPPPKSLLQAVARAGIPHLVAPVQAHGRLELLHYLREVSISHDTHRYGSVLQKSTSLLQSNHNKML